MGRIELNLETTAALEADLVCENCGDGGPKEDENVNSFHLRSERSC
jgi:hypothetical protein